MELTSGRPVRTSSGAAGEGREACADQQWCSFDYVGGSADLLAGHTRRRIWGRYWGGDREQIRMHCTDRKPLHPVVQHTWAEGRTHARAAEEAGSPVRVASYSRPFEAVCSLRAAKCSRRQEPAWRRPESARPTAPSPGGSTQVMYRLDEAPERPQKLALRPQQPDRRARQSPPHASPPVVPRPTCDVREGSTRKSTLIFFTRTSSGHIRGPQRPYRWPVWAVNLSWGSAVLPKRDSFQRGAGGWRSGGGKRHKRRTISSPINQQAGMGGMGSRQAARAGGIMRNPSLVASRFVQPTRGAPRSGRRRCDAHQGTQGDFETAPNRRARAEMAYEKRLAPGRLLGPSTPAASRCLGRSVDAPQPRQAGA